MAGHREIEQLHDIAREMLLDYREELTARWKAGERNSDLKRVKEQLNNLDLDPWSYGDILDDALSKGADAKQVMKELRNHQSRTMKLWEVLSSDTIHHIIGKRTGGDSLAHVDGKKLREAVAILIDKYGHRFANDPSNYLSLADYAHKGQFGKGLEREWGIKNTEHRDFMAHVGGNTQSHAKGLTAREMQDVPSIVEALERLMQPQEASAQNASLLDAGRQNKVNQIVGLQGYGAESIEEITQFKKMVKKILPIIKPDLIDSYNELLKFTPELINGGVHLNAGFGVDAYKKLKGFLQDNLGGEATGALYGLLMDPEMQQAVENGDGQKIATIVGRDAILGGVMQQSIQYGAKVLPGLAAPVAAAGAALNTAMPIAAVSQIQGSTDPQVQITRNREALENNDPVAVRHAQAVPQNYGKQGPSYNPETGQGISEPGPMFDLTPLYEKVINFVSGGAHIERKKLERQEQLRALPATHPARHGFALGGGM
mgnify:CR=1 FL=1